jgi:hypothetical protein
MDDTWMNNAYGVADGRLPAGGPGAAAGHWPAEVVKESAAAVPLRLVQVYLTPVIDEFLRQARSMAIVQGLDVSASAVVRHAMERLMATASPAEMVELLGSPKGQSQHKRGRPRR